MREFTGDFREFGGVFGAHSQRAIDSAGLRGRWMRLLRQISLSDGRNLPGRSVPLSPRIEGKITEPEKPTVGWQPCSSRATFLEG